MTSMTEFEVRFLTIDKAKLIQKLHTLATRDLGEAQLEEIIFYDRSGQWRAEQKVVRLRANGMKTTLAYKHHHRQAVDGADEVEFEVNDIDKATTFLEQVDLVLFRRQQKLRHTFQLDQVTIDIDTWPRIPSYVELEGPTEMALQQAARQLGLEWSKAVYANALEIIEQYYHIPVGGMRWFTFERFE